MLKGARRAVAASIAVVALGACAPAALAGEAHVETIGGATVIVFTAAPGEKQSLLVDRDPGFTGDQYQLNDQDNNVQAGPGCSNAPRPPFAGTDPKIVRCGSSATTIQVNLGDGDDTVRFGNLSGHPITDVIDGGDGIDRLDASNGDGRITGGPGDDVIDGNAGNDEILAGADDDEIVAGPGSDTVNGEGGDDKILGHAKPDTQEIGTVTDFRAGDVNLLSGGDGADSIVGDNGTDEIRGEAGNDTLAGAGGAGAIDGGAGNDTMDEGDTPGDPNGGQPAGPLASDTIRGGPGKDTATYCTRHYSGGEAKKHPLTITLDNRGNDGEKGEKDVIGPSGDVENVLGGGVTSDRITGNSKANVLTGDCLTTVAGSGSNKIYGGSGNDKLVGGDAKDLLNGGKGADQFLGNEDADTIQAKDGARDKSINCDGVGVKSSKDSATVDRSDPTAFNCDKLRR
ncbi:MAG TPA: calcium-binding protein [Thermoleophilaceae bacterium]|jgi:Ca2+-binding RTX toxin-like protein